MIMPVKQVVETRTYSNKCKYCRIAHFCLPAKIDKKSLKMLGTLHFNSRVLKPGEYLCRQGEHSKYLYALRSGLLKSVTTKKDGQEFIMGFHSPPELFGWESIDEGQKSVSIIALDHANVCEIPVDKIAEITSNIPEIERQIFSMVSLRIRRDNFNLLRGSSEQRVASFLLQLSEYNTLLGYPYYLCRLKMTHQDIANYLRIAPETISRTFKVLQSKKLIKVVRKKVFLNDIDKLRLLAEFDEDDLPQVVQQEPASEEEKKLHEAID